MTDLAKTISKEESLNEISYKYNIGFQEMVEFYAKASPSEIKKMEKFIKGDNWHGFKKLIKNVLGVDLKG